MEKKYKARERLAKVEPALEEQFQASRVLGEWVYVSSVPRLCGSWLWTWGYDTVYPLSYVSVGISCAGVMVPCLLSHNYVDFSFLWVMTLCVPYLMTVDFSCPRGLVLCVLVGSFYHFRGIWYCIFRVDADECSRFLRGGNYKDDLKRNAHVRNTA